MLKMNMSCTYGTSLNYYFFYEKDVTLSILRLPLFFVCYFKFRFTKELKGST